MCKDISFSSCGEGSGTKGPNRERALKKSGSTKSATVGFDFKKLK